MAEAKRRDSGLGLDLGTTGGDWLFKRGDQVFGPVPAKVLVDMLYKGEVDGNTRVCSGESSDGEYQRLAEVPFFVIHVKKAEAQIRVQKEATGVRAVEKRKNIMKGTGGLVVAFVLLGAGGYGAWWLATTKPWKEKSALLEDFGDGIAIASAARIGGKRADPSAEEEIVVATDPGAPPGTKAPPRKGPVPGGKATPGGKAVASATPGGRPAEGDLTVAQYDPSSIQATIAREQRTLAPCVKAEAKRSPDFSGEIPIEFSIGNDGKVAQLWVDQVRFKKGELYDCLLRTLQAWSFKPFPGERPTVSLSFRIGGR
jgi:hypothetical protein